ncbi:MAG: hypothetical protein RL277_384 [Planctomycetota bacterium]
MLTHLPAEILEFVAARSRPCLLMCDGTGRILCRFTHSDSSVPVDICSAGALDACLSRPVLEEWRDLIRESICSNQALQALVVLDGVGFDLGCMPTITEAGGRAVWLHVAGMGDQGFAACGAVRRTLLNHEWGVLDALSRSQLDTLRDVTRGLCNQQIADRLHRSKRAVEWHIRHLHRLLCTGSREGMARIGRMARLDTFEDAEWVAVLTTRPARRTLEEYALHPSSSRIA